MLELTFGQCGKASYEYRTGYSARLPQSPHAPFPLQGATVLNHVTWSPLAQFVHPPVVRGPPTVVAYGEVVEDLAHRVVAVSAR